VTEKPPDKVNPWRQAGLLATIPFILALAPIVGFVIGSWLDSKFRTGSWLSVILLVLGFVAGVRETIQIIKLAQRED
jgi:ATP synthase protein I